MVQYSYRKKKFQYACVTNKCSVAELLCVRNVIGTYINLLWRCECNGCRPVRTVRVKRLRSLTSLLACAPPTPETPVWILLGVSRVEPVIFGAVTRMGLWFRRVSVTNECRSVRAVHVNLTPLKRHASDCGLYLFFHHFQYSSLFEVQIFLKCD